MDCKMGSEGHNLQQAEAQVLLAAMIPAVRCFTAFYFGISLRGDLIKNESVHSSQLPLGQACRECKSGLGLHRARKQAGLLSATFSV